MNFTFFLAILYVLVPALFFEVQWSEQLQKAEHRDMKRRFRETCGTGIMTRAQDKLLPEFGQMVLHYHMACLFLLSPALHILCCTKSGIMHTAGQIFGGSAAFSLPCFRLVQWIARYDAPCRESDANLSPKMAVEEVVHRSMSPEALMRFR